MKSLAGGKKASGVLRMEPLDPPQFLFRIAS